MANTKRNIYYPNNYDEIADVPEELKTMAESIDSAIDEAVEESTYDDTDLKNRVSENEQDIQDLETNKADKNEIPTKTSDLINDSGFIEDANYVHTDNNFTNEDKDQITDNKDDIVEINQTIGAINTDIAEINQDINEIKTEQTTQNTNISANANSIANLNSAVSDINDDIEDLETSLTSYSLITETGSQIELNINSSDFKLKAILKDKNGNTIYTSNIIDLPLETMVVGASYDNVTKEVVLTLQNGTTVRFSVADLVSGLVSADELQTILGDYVKNTDYATSSKGGVVKVGNYAINKTSGGELYSTVRAYNDYTNDSAYEFISKGTLENVIAGKDLTTKAYVDSLVGDIESILEELDIGGGVE